MVTFWYKTAFTTFLVNFGKNWATIKLNIWSHLVGLQRCGQKCFTISIPGWSFAKSNLCDQARHWNSGRAGNGGNTQLVGRVGQVVIGSGGHCFHTFIYCQISYRFLARFSSNANEGTNGIGPVDCPIKSKQSLKKIFLA